MAKQTFTTGSVLTATQMNNLQANDYNWDLNSQTASYVLVAADAGKRVQMNAAGATTITVNTSLFTAGDTVVIQNIGAGTCTVTAGTATVNKATNASLALAQYQGGTLYFVSASSAIFFPFDVGSGSTTPTAAGAWVYGNGSNQDITTSTTSDIVWEAESYDTDAYHSTSTNTARFTIPSGKAGKYLLGCVIYWEGVSANSYTIICQKNGTTSISSNTINGSSGIPFYQTLITTADLAVGDYIIFRCTQNSGTTRTVRKGAITDSYAFISYQGA